MAQRMTVDPVTGEQTFRDDEATVDAFGQQLVGPQPLPDFMSIDQGGPQDAAAYHQQRTTREQNEADVYAMLRDRAQPDIDYGDPNKSPLAVANQAYLASLQAMKPAAPAAPNPYDARARQMQARVDYYKNLQNPFGQMADPYAANNAGLRSMKGNVYGQAMGLSGQAITNARANMAQRGIALDSGLAQGAEIDARNAAALQAGQAMGQLDAQNYQQSADWNWRRTAAADQWEQARQAAMYGAEDMGYGNALFDPLKVQEAQLRNAGYGLNNAEQATRNQYLGQALQQGLTRGQQEIGLGQVQLDYAPRMANLGYQQGQANLQGTQMQNRQGEENWNNSGWTRLASFAAPVLGAAGTIIGSAIAPGVGTAAGGMLGSGLGNWIAGMAGTGGQEASYSAKTAGSGTVNRSSVTAPYNPGPNQQYTAPANPRYGANVSQQWQF
jgi:hypothetical protein